VWQQLFDSLKDRKFMIVAVAEAARGAEACRQWIEQAQAGTTSTYWSLIDTEGTVAELYAMVNVPDAIWIDETGRIVRGPENAGSTDHFRRMDLKTRTMTPADQAARLAARTAYLDAVKDWVLTGRHALPADAARRALPAITPEVALGNAHFKLGLWLRRNGHAAEGDRHFAEASRLHPESWIIWRNAADFQEAGKAGGPEFWARVQALGDKPYYPPADLPGIPRRI
jgi:hypothetical protein